MKKAYEQLLEKLEVGEEIEAVVFGDYVGCDEPQNPIPDKIKCIPLTFEQAKPYMLNWSVIDEYGSADCYAMHVWTNQRVMWITQYDGAASIDSMPRNPIECIPEVFGGG